MKNFIKRVRTIPSELLGGNRWSSTVALASVALLAAWMGNVSGGYFVNQWVLVAFILIVLVVLVSVAGVLQMPRHRAVVLALGLFTAYTAWTFASILWSANKGDAWIGAGQTLLYLLAFWVVVGCVMLGASRRWALAVSCLGPAVIAALTLPVLAPRLDEMFENNRLVGSVGYYNGEAAFLLISFWVAVYLAGSRHVNPLLRGAVLAGAIVSADLAILTQSRGAMVAMAVSLPVFFLFSGARLRGLLALVPIAAAVYVAFPDLNNVYITFVEGGDPALVLERTLPTIWLTAAAGGLYGMLWGLVDWRWRPPRLLVSAAGGTALAGCLVVLFLGWSAVSERTGDPMTVTQQKWKAFKNNDVSGEDVSRYMSASGSGRYTLWQVAWEDFTENPVAGIGTHNYEATYYQLREQNVGYVRQAHTLPLEILSERGVIGGVLFAGFLTTCLFFGLWKRFRKLRQEGMAQIGALVASITYWFVHSSAEWFWQMPAVTMLAMIYLALLVSPWGTADQTPEVPGWPLRAVGLTVAALALVVLIPLYASERYLAASHSAKDPAQALAVIERAQEFNPLSSQLPRREAEIAMEAGEWERVETAYEREARLDPEHYSPHMFRAAFHEQRGEPEEALKHYQKAQSLNPLDEDIQRRIERLQTTAAD